jgi:PAS domain S-box-containing protein
MSSLAHQIVYAYDLSGRITFVNRAAELISGYSREEACAMNIADLVAPEFGAHLDKLFRLNADFEVGMVEEIDIIAKDGSRVALEVSIRVVPHEGRQAEIQGIAVPSVLRGKCEMKLPRCLHANFSAPGVLIDVKNSNWM